MRTDQSKSLILGLAITLQSTGFWTRFVGMHLFNFRSPFYAAPEMILGKKYEGPEVDMWSLGIACLIQE
jgi:serine/threonine protein kinase